MPRFLAWHVPDTKVLSPILLTYISLLGWGGMVQGIISTYKTFGHDRTCFYFNLYVSVLYGPLSYVDNGQIFSKFGLAFLWTKMGGGGGGLPTVVGSPLPTTVGRNPRPSEVIHSCHPILLSPYSTMNVLCFLFAICS